MALTTFRLGKYEIIEELGKGGFATVYRALDTTLDREVALKVLDPLLMREETWVARFHREARAVARLDHPRIVTIYEIGEDEARLCIAMDPVKGASLKDLIAERGRLPWDETLEILGQVAVALDYAHGQGVLHRDLKPGNILLDPRKGAVLTDFGFAKLVGESSMSVSISGGVVGTPAYIAPEVWDGEEPTPQTDLYALACIAFEMLTGEVLFSGKTPSAVMRKHLLDGPQFPAEWPPSVPGQAGEVLARALVRDPAERFETASVFWQALEASAAKARVAVAPSPAPRAGEAVEVPEGKAHRRIPSWAWIMGGVAVVALIVGLTVALIDGKPETLVMAESTPSATVTPSPTATPVPSIPPSDTATSTPTATVSSTSTAIPTVSANASPTATPTRTPAVTPSPSATRAPSSTPSHTPRPMASATATTSSKRLDHAGMGCMIRSEGSCLHMEYGVDVTDLSSGQTRRIFTNPDRYRWVSFVSAAWSPMGTEMLVSCRWVAEGSWESSKATGGILWIVDEDGTIRKEIVRSGTFQSAIWSPTGEAIAVRVESGGDFGVFTIRPDGTELRRVESSDISDWPRYWSVDGQWIVVASESDGKLYALEVEGSRRLPLAQSGELQVYDQRYYPWRITDEPTCSGVSSWRNLFWGCE